MVGNRVAPVFLIFDDYDAHDDNSDVRGAKSVSDEICTTKTTPEGAIESRWEAETAMLPEMWKLYSSSHLVNVHQYSPVVEPPETLPQQVRSPPLA
ncbi:hypothetical protein GCM10007242_15190 [Pigmentiphaga litoralis]|nr:hypothetical protein GCM10007242_15190 [Pigmentiphaga litoralis]